MGVNTSTGGASGYGVESGDVLGLIKKRAQGRNWMPDLFWVPGLRILGSSPSGSSLRFEGQAKEHVVWIEEIF